MEKLKNITNLNQPPDKDADYDDLTPEVQEAAKSHFEHLGKAASINKKVKRAYKKYKNILNGARMNKPQTNMGQTSP